MTNSLDRTRKPRTVVRRRKGTKRLVRFKNTEQGRVRQDDLRRARNNADVAENVIHAARAMMKAVSGDGTVETTITRRADQHDVFVDAAKYLVDVADHVKHKPSALTELARLIAPPRTGKTIIMGEITAAAGVSTLIIAPTKTLVEQHRETLEQQMPTVNVGVYYGEEKQPGVAGVTITTYDYLQYHFARGTVPDFFRHFTFIFLDEAHKSMTEKRMTMIRMLFHPSAVRIAFTATPDYDSKRTLGSFFPRLIHEITLQEAHKLGLLADLLVWIEQVNEDASEVEIVRGDYDELQLARIMSSAPFFQRVLEIRYEDDNAQMPTLITCTTRQQAYDLQKYMAANLPEGRKPPVLMISDTRHRKRLRKQFERGTIDTFITVGVLLEGWNSPRCKLLIDMAPTRSLVRGKQKFFRPMTKDGDRVAKLYMLLPQNLAQPPVFPSDFFGTSIQVTYVGYIPPAKDGPTDPMKPIKRTRGTRLKNVSTKARILVEGVYADPELDAKDDTQLRAVILASCDGEKLPTYGTFCNLDIQHALFTGPGVAFLRFCGVYSARAYLHMLDRVLPGQAALRYLKRNERSAYNDVPVEQDLQYLITHLHQKPKHAGMGWRALCGPEPVDAEVIEDLVDRQRLIGEMMEGFEYRLSDRQRYVLTRRYGLEDGTLRTLGEVGKEIGMSRERTRQIEREGLIRLREHMDRLSYEQLVFQLEIWSAEQPRWYTRHQPTPLPSVQSRLAGLQRFLAAAGAWTVRERMRIQLRIDKLKTLDEVPEQEIRYLQYTMPEEWSESFLRRSIESQIQFEQEKIAWESYWPRLFEARRAAWPAWRDGLRIERETLPESDWLSSTGPALLEGNDVEYFEDSRSYRELMLQKFRYDPDGRKEWLADNPPLTDDEDKESSEDPEDPDDNDSGGSPGPAGGVDTTGASAPNDDLSINEIVGAFLAGISDSFINGPAST